MKKFVVLLLFVCCFVVGLFCPTSFTYANEESAIYVVNADSTFVFSDASFKADKLAPLSLKDQLFVLMKDGSPVSKMWEGYKFYEINLAENQLSQDPDTFGYVFADFLTLKSTEIVSIPNFNAHTNKACNVFFMKDGTITKDENIKLPEGYEIFLNEGFDAKKEFLPISFVYEGQVLYGYYLKKDDVNPNGINPVLITCIVLIVAVLSIIFAWVFMKTKHVKLKKHKFGKYNLNNQN